MNTRILGFLVTVTAAVFGISAPASAVDAVLYEVTEAVKVTTKGSSFKSSTATLTGDVAAGTPLCPTLVAQQLKVSTCTIIVRATGKADDTTGVGPASGEFDIVVQDTNSADAAEIVVMKGSLSGTIDLSNAFQKQQPLGSIGGTFSATGLKGSVMDGLKAGGTFSGKFRLPFRQAGKPSYLLDDGSIVLAQPQEYSLGQAMVRLEVTFVSSGK